MNIARSPVPVVVDTVTLPDADVATTATNHDARDVTPLDTPDDEYCVHAPTVKPDTEMLNSHGLKPPYPQNPTTSRSPTDGVNVSDVRLFVADENE
jgi:hypothetical protein